MGNGPFIRGASGGAPIFIVVRNWDVYKMNYASRKYYYNIKINFRIEIVCIRVLSICFVLEYALGYSLSFMLINGG